MSSIHIYWLLYWMYKKDSDEMRDILLQYCNHEKSMTIGMLRFCEQETYFRKSSFPTQYTGLVIDEMNMSPLHTFHLMAELLKIKLMADCL
mgnify:CR=1 FL=1